MPIFDDDPFGLGIVLKPESDDVIIARAYLEGVAQVANEPDYEIPTLEEFTALRRRQMKERRDSE